MPRWSQADLDEYDRKRASSKAGSAGVCATKPERIKGPSLVSAGNGEAQGGSGLNERYSIAFRIYSRRPNDWDNISLKQIQDCCVTAGFLPDDNWRVLQGQVISCKVHSQAEERTEIEISQLT